MSKLAYGEFQSPTSQRLTTRRSQNEAYSLIDKSAEIDSLGRDFQARWTTVGAKAKLRN